MRLFGLIGYPLAQSFSKKYFDAKIAKEGLPDRFENFPIVSIDEFPQLLANHPQLHGLAVTIPYKLQVIPFIDDMSGLPEGLHSVNCIRIRKGKLYGFNTDHTGFEKSLGPLVQPWHKKALILGNGGVTAAVVYVLKKWKIEYQVVSRQLKEDSALTYSDLDRDILREHTLIINTTPLGMYPNIETYPPIPYQFITEKHLLFDMVYNPQRTVFLQKGEEQGAVIKNGYDMLELQAEVNWRIWNEA
jgi:shikimate dehydrogenase